MCWFFFNLCSCLFSFPTAAFLILKKRHIATSLLQNKQTPKDLHCWPSIHSDDAFIWFLNNHMDWFGRAWHFPQEVGNTSNMTIMLQKLYFWSHLSASRTFPPKTFNQFSSWRVSRLPEGVQDLQQDLGRGEARKHSVLTTGQVLVQHLLQQPCLCCSIQRLVSRWLRSDSTLHWCFYRWMPRHPSSAGGQHQQRRTRRSEERHQAHPTIPVWCWEGREPGRRRRDHDGVTGTTLPVESHTLLLHLQGKRSRCIISIQVPATSTAFRQWCSYWEHARQRNKYTANSFPT